MIFLPIFTLSLPMIFHEIHHALSMDILFFTEDASPLISLFKTEYAEELVNDYIAQLAYRNFLKLGGKVPNILTNFSYINQYKKNDFLVQYLFEVFGDVILESLITKNFNLFIELVGKDRFIKLCNLIEDLYKNGFNPKKYSQLIHLIDEMALRKEEIKEIDYEEYLRKLENRGVRLRRL